MNTPTRIFKLFLLTYEDGEETRKHPIYALASELAINQAMDWLIERKEYTYRSVEEAQRGEIIDGTFFAAKKVEPVAAGVHLYVHEFFIGHEVHYRAIYAANEQFAIVAMNQYYNAVGLGNCHKTLNKSIDGIIIDGAYYAPSATT